MKNEKTVYRATYEPAFAAGAKELFKQAPDEVEVLEVNEYECGHLEIIFATALPVPSAKRVHHE